mmetsp:Transcript_79488/g.199843  ORF Transcript_79488/g.199843 Transcript_79488/m.199843 type:complete len:280 (-) Transcript_79488:3-842(-)
MGLATRASVSSSCRGAGTGRRPLGEPELVRPSEVGLESWPPGEVSSKPVSSLNLSSPAALGTNGIAPTLNLKLGSLSSNGAASGLNSKLQACSPPALAAVVLTALPLLPAPLAMRPFPLPLPVAACGGTKASCGVNCACTSGWSSCRPCANVQVSAFRHHPCAEKWLHNRCGTNCPVNLLGARVEGIDTNGDCKVLGPNQPGGAPLDASEFLCCCCGWGYPALTCLLRAARAAPLHPAQLPAARPSAGSGMLWTCTAISPSVQQGQKSSSGTQASTKMA